MSLRRRQTEIYRLDFDPSSTKPENGDARHFEWAIDHADQDSDDLCWAACLSNALSCVGRYVDQEEIFEWFRKKHGGPPKAIDDNRIPSADHAVELWRAFGFSKAAWRAQNDPMPFDALAEEIADHGPVQIELWPENTSGTNTPVTSHLVLLFGVREAPGKREVYVSDPDPKTMGPQWYPYELMLKPNPLPSGFGKWQRTYVNLTYDNRYLRRFVGRPARFLGTIENGGGGGAGDDVGPKVKSVHSQLEFEAAPDPDPPLTDELALASYGYRYYRYRDASEEKRPARKADLERPLFLSESIPIWRPPHVILYNEPLRDQLFPYRPSLWHHQIFDSAGPRYYAQAYYFETLRQRPGPAWRTTWMGERWRAKQVDRAIDYLDTKFGDLAESVRMVWFSDHRLMTLFLPERNLHVVASVHEDQQKAFPLLQELTDEELRKILAGI